jgi:hypothetical protein
MLRLAVVVVFLAGVLIGACSAPRTPLLTYPIDDGASPAGVLMAGRIEASPNSPCLVLKPTGYPPIGLAWPPGFSATFDPLHVYDATGTLVASEGDEVEIGGTLVNESNPGCRTDSTLMVVGVGRPSENAN